MQTTYQGGNAGDMGEGLSSKLLLIPVFGVGGVTPIAETLPMNQDCEGEESRQGDTVERKVTYRNPSTISTHLFHGLFFLHHLSAKSRVKDSKLPNTHIGPVVIPLKNPQQIILHQIKLLLALLLIRHEGYSWEACRYDAERQNRRFRSRSFRLVSRTLLCCRSLSNGRSNRHLGFQETTSGYPTLLCCIWVDDS
jgi:hypothetical protein